MQSPDPFRWARVEAVLDEVLNRDPLEWHALLNERCGGDNALRAEMESLLRVGELAQQYPDSSPSNAAACEGAEAAFTAIDRARIGNGLSAAGFDKTGTGVGAATVTAPLPTGALNRILCV